MEITLKGFYDILGVLYPLPEAKIFEFKVPMRNDYDVTVVVIPEKNSVKSFCNFKVSDDLWKLLQEDKFHVVEDLCQNIKDELNDITSILIDSAKKVLSLIKYTLDYSTLQEQLISVNFFYWKIERSDWKRFPFESHRIFVYIKAKKMLDEISAKDIQKLIDIKYEPLLALRHLHRAINEDLPRYKWIDATIAAELAIKEFLIRIKPEIEVLLSELPSPPIRKLYGPILKKYIGESSPKLNQLEEGTKIRNKLIHHPKEEILTEKKVKQYISDVAEAIDHLLAKLN